MEQVACDVHTETVKKYDEDTDKDYESDSNDDRDDNEDPDKIRGQPQPLLDIQDI